MASPAVRLAPLVSTLAGVALAAATALAEVGVATSQPYGCGVKYGR